MNIKGALAYGVKKLNHLENPQLEAEILLLSCLWEGHRGRAFLRTAPEKKLNLTDQIMFRWRVWQRARRIPTAYILNHFTWNDLDLYVDYSTLIPRDETETLCHHILTQQSELPRSILDVGTGSGCLAIWLKTKFPQAQVNALDISGRALKIAHYNAKVNHTSINFLQSHLLKALAPKTHFDLMVANLPYVPKNLEVKPEVQKEPAQAIFSGTDGLEHIRAFATEIQTKSIRFKQLWLEFLPEQADEVAMIFKKYEAHFYKAIDGQIFFAQIKPRAAHTLPQK